MIPSKNNSNPFYSFGKSKRFLNTKETKTDFIYDPGVIYKFSKVYNKINI